MFDLMQYALIFYDFQLILAQMPSPPALSHRVTRYSHLWNSDLRCSSSPIFASMV